VAVASPGSRGDAVRAVFLGPPGAEKATPAARFDLREAVEVRA